MEYTYVIQNATTGRVHWAGRRRYEAEQVFDEIMEGKLTACLKSFPARQPVPPKVTRFGAMGGRYGNPLEAESKDVTDSFLKDWTEEQNA